MHRTLAIAVIALFAWTAEPALGGSAEGFTSLTVIFHVHGTDQTLANTSSSGCEGIYARVGAPVFVLDGVGGMLTVSPLSWGLMSQSNPYQRICDFALVFPELPTSNQYLIELGPYILGPFTPADLESMQWTVPADVGP